MYIFTTLVTEQEEKQAVEKFNELEDFLNNIYPEDENGYRDDDYYLLNNNFNDYENEIYNILKDCYYGLSELNYEIEKEAKETIEETTIAYYEKMDFNEYILGFCLYDEGDQDYFLYDMIYFIISKMEEIQK